MSAFGRFTPGVLPGQTPLLQDSPQEGHVVAVSSAGAVAELIEMPGVTHGPAPWSLGSYATAAAAITAGFAPRVGDRCLIVFAGAGIARPWLVAWWR